MNFDSKFSHKKICILTDGWYPYWGGGQIHVWEVSKILVKNYNLKIDIFTRSLKDEKGKIYNKNETYFSGRLNIYRRGIPTEFLNTFGRFWWCFFIIFPILWRRYDLIHAQSFLPAVPAKILKFIKQIPLVYSVHGSVLEAWQYLERGFGMKFKKWLEKTLLCRFRYDQEITASSNFLRYKNVNKNIIVIPNGVNVEKFDRIQIKKNQVFQILFVGRFDKIKGLDYLIGAVKILSNKNYKFRVVLVGDGYYKERVIEQIHQHNLDNYFYFTGSLLKKDLINTYKSSHLFVLPSISEGQPLTLLEAWAAKLPVVVTDVGGNKEYVKNGINGYLVPARNVDMLANSIMKILKNYAKAEKMGQNGYNLVKQKYSWENTAEKIYAIYQKLAK